MDDLLDPQVLAALQAHQLIYKVLECDPELADTAAFCEHYGFLPEQSANTILVASRKVEPVHYAVCVVLANSRLDVNKKVCELMGVKRASFAGAETTKQLTSMQIGGVTAVGISDDIPLYIDSRVLQQAEVVMGGGNRASKLLLDSRELTKLPNSWVVENLAIAKG